MRLSPQTAIHPKTIEPGQRFVLRGVSWAFYENVLKEIGEQRIFVTYDKGVLELMSPSLRHDGRKSLIARLIETMALELHIDIMGCGSVTCRREDIEKGLEPDECYYIANYSLMWQRDELDLAHDPPPDLALEVDITSSSLDRESIYAGLGIPELWRWDGTALKFLQLQSDRRYSPISESVSFPGLPASEMERFVRQSRTVRDNQLVRNFQDWVRQNLKQK